jgi:hypothetical protein
MKENNNQFWKDISNTLKKDITDPEIIGRIKFKGKSEEKVPTESVFSVEDEKSKKLITHLNQIYNTTQKNERYNRAYRALQNPEIDGAMNIYADEATTQSEDGEIFHITCSNEKVISTVTELFDRIGLSEKAWSIIKNFCSYGDEYYEIRLQSDAKGIYGINYVPRQILDRVEENGELRYFQLKLDQKNPDEQDIRYFDLGAQTTADEKGNRIRPFRIVHWKIDSTKYNPYGQGVIDSIIAAIEELKLLQQSIIIARVSRAPERRVYRINVGQQTGERAIQAAKLIIENFKNKKVVDVINNTKVDRESDFLSASEDIVIPYRQGEEAHTIDTLQQLQAVGVEDVEFFRDRIFPGLGVPRQYLFDDTFANANTNLSNKSLPFAKRIQRVQRFFITGSYKLAYIELLLKGFKEEDFADLTISMNNPSTLAETQRIELLTNKWNLVTSIKGLNAEKVFIPDYWIYKNILNFSNEEILEVILLSKIQEADGNPFSILPAAQRPMGWDHIDTIKEEIEQAKAAAGGGGGEEGVEPVEGEGDATQDELDKQLEGGGFAPEEELGEEPAAETPTETPAEAPENADTTPNPNKKLYLENLRKQALDRKKTFFQKKQKHQREEFYNEQEMKKEQKKYTKISANFKYFENKKEFIGIESLEIMLKENSKNQNFFS